MTHILYPACDGATFLGIGGQRTVIVGRFWASPPVSLFVCGLTVQDPYNDAVRRNGQPCRTTIND